MSDILEIIQEKVNNTDLVKSVGGWVVEYPKYNKITDEQMHSFWAWDEPEVENDVQDIRVRLSHSEKHGLITTLKLFTKYEMMAGDDYWTTRFTNRFKRPELQRMGTMFGAVEYNSHAPFYNKINELLFLDTAEFYSEWKEDPVLRERMSFIGNTINNPNDLLSLGAFSFIEGAVLYSSFAFLKHFQSQDCGKDLIKNICRGINLSVADENTHAVGGALVFRDLIEQAKLTEEETSEIKRIMTEVAIEVYEHESKIIDMLYSEGDIENLPKSSLKDFVKHRCNLCISQLGFGEVFTEELDNFVKGWFYKNINSVQFHDFFTGSGSEYNINWKEGRFGSVWEEEV